MPDPWSSSNPQSTTPVQPAAPAPAQPAAPALQPVQSGQQGGSPPFVPSPIPPPPSAGQAPVSAPAKPLPVPQPGPTTTPPLPVAPPPLVAPLPLDIGSLSLRESTEIQGNVLAGFRKDHQVFAFLQLPSIPAQAQGWLKELIPRIAVTKEVAAFNQRFSDARRQNGGDDPESLQSKWVNIGLTANGLKRFDLSQIAVDLNSFSENFSEFVAGAASRAPLLGDTGPRSDPSQWLIGGPNQSPADVILTVAADDINDLLVEMEKLRAIATKYGVVTLFEQRGNTLSGDRAGHEHFGFRDGVSQPGTRGFDAPGAGGSDGRDHSNETKDSTGSSLVSAGEFVLGYPREGGQAAWPCPEWMKNGSFQVWRRLSQDVPGFWAQMTQLRAASPSAFPAGSMTEDGLAAKLMGRWRSGTPLDAAPATDNRSARDPKDDNDFNFDGRTNSGDRVAPGTLSARDSAGLRCPLDAHIRKMNPRDGNEALRRIIRRGVPFGLPFDPSSGRGQGVDADRGLIFMAFMANIKGQFEFLQEAWANSTFPGGGAGCDPIIGAPIPVAPITGAPVGNQPTHTIPQSGGTGVPLVLQRFVHTTGAVYAFAPSMKTLNALAKGIF